MTHVTLTVNGKRRSTEVEDRDLLVDLLREKLRLTGTHVGCDTSQCGACTVLVNGAAVKSCAMFAVQAEGARVTTIEGLAKGETLHPIQQAFHEQHGLQCGFCTPGMVMMLHEFLRAKPRPLRARGTLRSEWEHVPLHRLSEHRRFPRFMPRRRCRRERDTRGVCLSRAQVAPRGGTSAARARGRGTGRLRRDEA